MKTSTSLLPGLLLFCVFLSCEEPKDIAPHDFISATIDDEVYKYEQTSSEVDTFSSAYYYSNTGSQINLIRRGGGRTMEIYLLGVPLDDIKLPYEMRPQFQWKDLRYKVTSECQFCEYDSINYSNSYRDTPPEFKLTIRDKTNDVLTGDFYGTVFTRTGKSKTVSRGEFRITLIRVPQ
jgi:hypothetical protein